MSVLFIVIVTLYQLLSLKLDKMDVEPRPRPRTRWKTAQSEPSLFSQMNMRLKGWWSGLRRKKNRSRTEAHDRSSFDSTIGLLKTWSTAPSQKLFSFKPPCLSRGKTSYKGKGRPPSLRPFMLSEKVDADLDQSRESLDVDETHSFLRSPLAFAYDIDYSVVSTSSDGKERQRVRFLDEPETPKPQGAYTSPIFNDRENKLHRRTLSNAASSRSPIDSSPILGSPVSVALNVIPPSRARVRDLWLLNPQSANPDHPSSIGYYSDYKDLDRSPKSHRRRDYRFPCPRNIAEEEDDPFVIGDASDRDSSSFEGR